MTAESKPSEGAFMAACIMGRERPELQNSFAWGTDECMVAASIIDREAVAPAVRDLAQAALEMISVVDDSRDDLALLKARDQLADACAPYRHLIEGEGE